MATIKAWRSAILHCTANPAEVGTDQAFEYFEDGLLVEKDGIIQALGNAEEQITLLDSTIEVEHHPEALIVPGFVDTHIHYPQSDMIASYGEQLLDWLNNYTFPEESKFADKQYASDVAERFLAELLRNGTTTALVFGTVHKQSVDAFFEAALPLNLRMICGKVMMDRHAPDYLTDTPETAYEDSKELIERWHNHGRLHYAVTPRFAPTSTSEQLAAAGKLLSEYDDLYMHTHLSENRQECSWVQELFPDSKNYLDVYDQHQLLSERSVFAHGIHLCDQEYNRLSETGSAIAFCPTSNLFLGSGLFNLEKAELHKVNVGMGTDVGGGTSFSMFNTLNEAYKVIQMQGQNLDPIKSFYLATLGGAKALRLDGKVGNLAIGSEADFVIIDKHATPLLSKRLERAKDIKDTLFALMILADDRAIQATYAMGQCVHQRDA
ncbi:guanine deaminase [Marinomonas ostreistagni]|uniref:Guanine deaminase n=1 Tax=Marinomonas ostreistagni TaxID=359209 RepID=A0ABS0Z7K6_9GAMM|nr:guanine deaminase [Marinomonas ostreistagni]MBJ7549640.1 guanine deaminase [Marinomonas ostreistagni]